MLFNLKSLLFVASSAAALVAAAPNAPVFTATQVYNTVVDHAPFIVQGTRTVIWTASPSTTLAQPTGPGIN